jgi:4-aminobutyrate aminotransferase-like enzyme
MNIEPILSKQQQYMWGQMNYYRRPISMARGQGMYMWDIEGKASSTSICSAGS